MKIIFFGTGEFAVPILEALIQAGYEIPLVLTQPDRPAGRGRKMHESAVKKIALQHQLNLLQPETLKDETIKQQLKMIAPDFIVVVAYGLMIAKDILELPLYDCLNVHASLLPKWRGASPIQQAILAGDEETGVGIMKMDVGLDTGPVYLNKKITISEYDTYHTLQERLALLGAEALIEAIPKIISKELIAEKQHDKQTTYAPKILKQHGVIDWSQSALAIIRKIRAYNPWPVAFSHLNDEVIRIWEAIEFFPTQVGSPGEIISFSKEKLIVATGKGLISIKKLQFAGGKILSPHEFYHSKKDFFAPGKIFQ